jgi:hypothetical protein
MPIIDKKYKEVIYFEELPFRFSIELHSNGYGVLNGDKAKTAQLMRTY